MDNATKEIMSILQEECAEVVQAVSKINRFGLNGVHPRETKTNQAHLEEELGDLLAMVELLESKGIVTTTGLIAAKLAKIEKLKKWSTIYQDQP